MPTKIFLGLELFPDSLPRDPISYPFHLNDFQLGKFTAYLQRAREIFQPCALEDADLAIMPINWETLMSAGEENLAFEFIEKATRFGRPTVSFSEVIVHIEAQRSKRI